MITVLLLIAVVNLALGFAAALWLEPRAAVDLHELPHAPAAVPAAAVSAPRAVKPVAARPLAPPAAPSFTANAEAAAASTGKVSEVWMKWLDEQKQQAGTLVGASAQVLKLRVGAYRDKLIDIDARVRRCSTQPDAATLRSLLGELKTANSEWLANQADATLSLAAHNRQATELVAIGSRLEDVLLEQAAQIETTDGNLALLDFESDLAAGCKRLVSEVRKLIDLAHNLRDRMHDVLLAIAREDQQVATLDNAMASDPLIGLPNRTGLEQQLLQLDELGRVGHVSLLDIDCFGRTVEKLGVPASDRLLVAVGHRLGVLAAESGSEHRLARYSGQQFAVVQIDVGRDSALTEVERVRQSIAATTFEVDGEAIVCTISCATSPLRPQEAPEHLLGRLEQALAAAKHAGHNQCCYDEGEGPRAVLPIETGVTAAREVVA